MNREPKFRAFVCGEMLPVLTIDFVNNAFYVLPECELEGGNQKEVIGIEKLIQYTGLKDKNGKEIYEGDILQSEFTGEFDLVEWETDEDGSFLYSGWRCLSDGEYTEDRVVAGNIHENPELLNSE